MRVSTGSPFETRIGYSRALREGNFVFVSGTTGYDYQTMILPEGVVAQCRNALSNIRAALAEAGAGFEHVVRVRYILPERGDFEPCWPLLAEAFAISKPAATMMVAGLLEPEMRIEIEVTALIPQGEA